jgi:hypothetical protein
MGGEENQHDTNHIASELHFDSETCKRRGGELENPSIKTSRKEARVLAKKLAAKARKNKVPCPREEILVDASRGIDQVAKLVFFKKLEGASLEWAMALLEKNMKSLYEGDGHKGAWGWDPKKKRRELTDVNAKFVVLYLSDAVTQRSTRGAGGNEKLIPTTTAPAAPAHGEAATCRARGDAAMTEARPSAPGRPRTAAAAVRTSAALASRAMPRRAPFARDPAAFRHPISPPHSAAPSCA